MARLTEKFVQQKALEKLTCYYREKFNSSILFAEQEFVTSKPYGGKRADGFICFNSPLQQNHSVSIEAKSHKTLGALLPYWNDKKLAIQSLFLALVAGVLATYLSFDFAWYWIFVISIITALFAILIYIGIAALTEPDKLKEFDVLYQVKQYPANEKWIAISVDSLNLIDKKKNSFYKNTNSEVLRSECKRHGIGLLLVNKFDQRIEVEPTYQKGTFTNCYCKQSEILSFLQSNG